MTIRMNRVRWMMAGALAALLLGGIAWARWRPATSRAWKTAPVERGEIVQRIQATGTLNALIQVSVGTQVSGVVTGLYADFNSLVKKGQLLARIDPTVLETQLADAQAAVDGARGTYEHAKAELERHRHLAAENLISASDLNTRETAFRTAQASLGSARAALDRARTNLGYCTILAPVDGVVVSRVVDVGQTVTASLSTPSLFTVAQDLSRMKLQVAVDEADIGLVRVGQRASFTVDSYPGRTFHAQVSEVQLHPTTSNNVVTYNVVLGVANESRGSDGGGSAAAPQTALYIPEGTPVYQGDMALFPGMTANVTLTVDERSAVLRVPNAALRYQPRGFTSPVADGDTSRGGHVWVLDQGSPRRLEVRTGLSDARYTEISGAGVREGLRVLVGESEAGSGSSEPGSKALVGQPSGTPPPPPA